MSGIAGVLAVGKTAEVTTMLDRMQHRGPKGKHVLETRTATLGLLADATQEDAADKLKRGIVADRASDSRYACAEVFDDHIVLERDPLGVAPLYYGHTAEGSFCFASEVKSLLAVTRDVHEFPPGHSYRDGRLTRYFELCEREPITGMPGYMAQVLRQRLDSAVDRRMAGPEVGVWLSGGLDSSAIAALACRLTRTLHTFAVGLAGSPDLKYAREVAEYLGTEHHEVVVTIEDLLAALSAVIHHLESFDTFVVRSGLINWFAGREAANYVSAVLSGEGADELFAGGPYFREIPTEDLPRVLLDAVATLHNTAFQRADRSAAAHGLVAYIPFAAPTVVDYALRIPPEYKRRLGLGKWILRHAMADCLPDAVLQRRHAKSWEGAGVGEMIAQYADAHISDQEFSDQRSLPNGWLLKTKEEILYFRVFQEHFGALEDVSWMGRNKWAPVTRIAS
jgi:asparagine synthase (glutamine-hydrolysing)